MPKPALRHSVVRLPLSAEQPLGASVTHFASPQAEPEFDMHYGLEMGIVLQGRMRLLLLETLLLFLSPPMLSSRLSKPRDVSGVIVPALELTLAQQRPIRVEEAA